ncbi:hypothetical protein H072_4644 [Dactylellina haptotyla CBS 200.50]|uniref:Uncharacterized protein n=1 Tax=Dactylellina haptotyla (strain CBS 200.50) TaxID=1284197 RepID=S8AEL7_DACHA|nr:hypothetical protein H072_4644 [Dactylellina haptotyla CBS 200.50]
MFYRALLVSLPLLLLAKATPIIQERATCNADNLLRLLRGGSPSNLPDALIFCNDYLSRNPSVTVTVSIVTPTVTVTTSSTSTVTNLFTVTNTVTKTDYFSVTDYTVVQTAVTSTLTGAVQKRATKQALSDEVTSSYPASRISSACNCLTLPAGTTITSYVTATAAQVTETVTVNSEIQTSLTVTDTVTQGTSITSSFTTTLTVTTTVTVQPSPSPFFKIQLLAPGNAADSTYLKLIVDIPNGGANAYPGGQSSSSPTFQLQPNGELYMTDFGSAWVPGPAGSYSWNQPAPWTSNYRPADGDPSPFRFGPVSSPSHLSSRARLYWIVDSNGIITITNTDTSLTVVMLCTYVGQTTIHVGSSVTSGCVGPINLKMQVV